MPVEFDCPDCGWHVINVVDQVLSTERCLTCQFIADQPDPLDRARLRALLCSPRPHRVPVCAITPGANDGDGASPPGAVPTCLSEAGL